MLSEWQAKGLGKVVVVEAIKKMRLVRTIDVNPCLCIQAYLTTKLVVPPPIALHEIKNDKLGDILLAGVFDGHAGTAASETCSGLLPTLFTTELMAVCDSAMDDATKIQQALEDAWEVTCDTYRNGCDENGECVADYDPAEGILYAATGSTTWVGKFLW